MKENLDGIPIRGKGYTHHNCECCGEEFIGRRNAKFCSSHCKNNYNNARIRERDLVVRKYLKIIEKNYRILKEYLESGKVDITHTELMRLGYKTDYLTRKVIYTVKGEKRYCSACGDLVLIPFSENTYKIDKNETI